MKKMLLVIAFVGILAGIYGFGRFHAPAVSSYLMTPGCVDYIRIGRTFVENPPQGALYDRSVRDEHGYTLYRENVEIGHVYIDTKTKRITRFEIRDCPVVHLENGISIGTSIHKALSKNGVRIIPEYYLDVPDASPDFVMEYKGITMYLSHIELTYTGKKKVENYEYDFKANDFKDKGQIVEFMCSLSSL